MHSGDRAAALLKEWPPAKRRELLCSPRLCAPTECCLVEVCAGRPRWGALLRPTDGKGSSTAPL